MKKVKMNDIKSHFYEPNTFIAQGIILKKFFSSPWAFHHITTAWGAYEDFWVPDETDAVCHFEAPYGGERFPRFNTSAFYCVSIIDEGYSTFTIFIDRCRDTEPAPEPESEHKNTPEE